MISEEVRRHVVDLRNHGNSYRAIISILEEELWEHVSYWSIHNIINSEHIDTVAEEEAWKKIRDMAKTSRWKTFNRKVNRALSYMWSVEEIRDCFKEALDEYERPEIIQWNYVYSAECSSAIVFLWDFHFWRWTKYLIENWNKTISYLLNSWYDDITLCFMWDLIESPRVTWMHDAQVLEMDYLWINQAVWCVDMIRDWISALINNNIFVRVLWLNGNHVRMSKDRDWDPERIVWCFMYEMLKMLFPDTYIEYSKDGVLQYDTMWYHLILSHWDNGFNNKNDIQILQALWSANKYNIIASWHYHSSAMTQWNWYTRLQIPSLNWQSEYEKNKFIAKSLPWFAILWRQWWNTHLSFKYLDTEWTTAQ